MSSGIGFEMICPLSSQYFKAISKREGREGGGEGAIFTEIKIVPRLLIILRNGGLGGIVSKKFRSKL